jgi:deoxyribonuclease V
VKHKRLHSWRLSPADAREIQQRLARRVSRVGEVMEPKYIAGVDIAAGRAGGIAQAAVVVLSYPELQLVEVELARGRLRLPYIPGLLSFRESPLILAACRKLSLMPDIVMVDGHGFAHPRRLGIASHLGLLLDIATIGCAKSRLCGSNTEPPDEPGSYTELRDGGETIGAVLRTRSGVKPVYISTGHRISLENAIHWAVRCCRGYRLPQPTRLAHLAAGGNLKQGLMVE